MARTFDPKSKIGVIKKLQVNEEARFTDAKWDSITVQVSNLRKNLEQKDKNFKVSFEDGVVIVKRIL